MSYKDLNIRAAHALGPDRFCIALLSGAMDDQYSSILQYDASKESRKWIASKVDNRVFLMCGYGNSYAFANRSGDVYITDRDTAVRIPIASKDNPEPLLQSLSEVEGSIWATEFDRSIYKMANDRKWEQRYSKNDFELESGFKLLNFNVLSGSSLDDMYVAGTASPPVDAETNTDMKAKIAEAKAAGNKEEAIRLKILARKIARTSKKTKEGRLYHKTDGAWEELGIAEYIPECIMVQSSERVYIGLNNGEIMVGNAEDGFDFVHVHDELGSTHSIAKINGRVVCQGSYGLFVYTEHEDGSTSDGERLKPTRSPENAASLAPLKVQTVKSSDGSELMFYFDYNFGVYVWDGADSWTQIEIPESAKVRRD